MALRPIKDQQNQEIKTLLKAQEDEERIYKNVKKSETDLILTRIRKIEKEYENLNDLSYVERIQLRSKSSSNQFNAINNKNIENTLINSNANSSSIRARKETAADEFSTIPVAPLNFAKQTKHSSSRRSLIRSPRSNSNRMSQKH